MPKVRCALQLHSTRGHDVNLIRNNTVGAMIPFNKKKHSDITITVTDGAEKDPREQTFFLHKFPLISKSHYFDENIPETNPAEGPLEMRITDFPGGPAAFEKVARYAYGMDIELSEDDIAYTYCACRYLRIPDLEKSTEEFMVNTVLPDPRIAAHVLRVATSIENMTDEMMEGLVGHCINAIAARFTPIPELNSLPSDCFACIVRNARDMDAEKAMLETAVLQFLDEKVTDDVAELTVDEFVEVVASPGRMDDMRYCENLYTFLEMMLRHFPADEDAEKLCRSLHDMGFWVCLPHVVIEKAYADRNVPDRYCTVALMAENRHLLKVNEQLAEQVDHLTSELEHVGGFPSNGGGRHP